jgi:hypothetical protein
MGRDVEKAKGSDKGKKRSLDKTAETPSESKRGCQEPRRGWRDVFDDLEYSDGPGDNIYVFG